MNKCEKFKNTSPRFMYPEQLKILKEKEKEKKNVTDSITRKYSDDFVEHKDTAKGFGLTRNPARISL